VWKRYFSGFDTFAESGKVTLFLVQTVVYIIKAGLERTPSRLLRLIAAKLAGAARGVTRP